MKTLDEREITQTIDNLTDTILEIEDKEEQKTFIRSLLFHCIDHPWVDEECAASMLDNIAGEYHDTFEYTGEYKDNIEEDEEVEEIDEDEPSQEDLDAPGPWQADH